jgi:nicotinamidase-related amidase
MTEGLRVSGRYYRMYPPGSFLGFAEKDLTLDLTETAVVAVDIYGPDEASNRNYSGMLSDHSASESGTVIRERIAPVLGAARSVGLPVIYLANSAPKIGLRESSYWENKWDTQHVDVDDLYSEDGVDPREYHSGDSNVLKYNRFSEPRTSDYFVRKHTHSGFFDTRLDTLLRNLRVRTLVCVGFALDMCLGATMIDALWRNYRVILLRDCTYAIELPGIDLPGAWTSRWITYVECAIGYTAMGDAFVAECERICTARAGDVAT